MHQGKDDSLGVWRPWPSRWLWELEPPVTFPEKSFEPSDWERNVNVNPVVSAAVKPRRHFWTAVTKAAVTNPGSWVIRCYYLSPGRVVICFFSWMIVCQIVDSVSFCWYFSPISWYWNWKCIKLACIIDCNWHFLAFDLIIILLIILIESLYSQI